MNTPGPSASGAKAPRMYKCGVCHELGHNARACPRSAFGSGGSKRSRKSREVQQKREEEEEKRRAFFSKLRAEGGAEEAPGDALGSDLDDSDDEEDLGGGGEGGGGVVAAGGELSADFSNMMLGSYTKVARQKSKWKVVLRDAIVRVNCRLPPQVLPMDGAWVQALKPGAGGGGGDAGPAWHAARVLGADVKAGTLQLEAAKGGGRFVAKRADVRVTREYFLSDCEATLDFADPAGAGDEE